MPEFYVKTGVRRMTTQQGAPLINLGVDITPEVIEKNKWYAFWDAPFVIPGVPGSRRRREPAARPAGRRNPGRLAERAGGQERIGAARARRTRLRAAAQAGRNPKRRREVPDELVQREDRRRESRSQLPRAVDGIFAGSLRFTSYRGSNLLRMEAIAKTDEQSVAYKYEGGLEGILDRPHASCDVARSRRRSAAVRVRRPQERHARDGEGEEPRARRRRGKNGSIATFTPPHVFFFTREVDTNLGYIWYRKDGDTQFGMGIRQAEGEEVQQYVENFALHNAPPGTMQRMAVYYLITPDSAEATRQAVMAYTHGDVFKPVPGYKTMVNHFHLRFTERLRASGSLDNTFEDLMVMRSAGINIVGLSDFHGDLRPNDPGLGRYEDQRDYYVASQKASDKDFLVTNWEEPTAYFGGHYNIDVPEERVLDEGAQSRAAVHGESAGIREGLSHGQHQPTCSRCWMPKAATGSMRTRARRARRAIPMRSSTRRG